MFLDREEKLKFWRKFFFAIEAIREVYTPDTAVGMNSDPKCLNIVGSVCPTREIGQVKLDLIPS